MKRHKHSLSHYKLATFDMGQLVPIGCYEVLPGDTVQHSTSLLLRVSPLVAPVMHPINVRVHHWFVPYRILWGGWEEFITGLSDAPPPQYSYPTGVEEGTVLDYMGVPTGKPGILVNRFFLQAYNNIWNEFYRDQDLQSARLEDDNTLALASWEKDYFTTARPWEQKGGEVTLPLGTWAPVRPDESVVPGPRFRSATDQRLGLDVDPGGAALRAGAGFFSQSGFDPVQGAVKWDYETGLAADLSNATAVSVNEVRRAFALQRYQEARALYGSRYTEYLAYLGVKSSDARLQRPEYLGGGKATISFSEVLKTGAQTDEDDDPVGSMKGHGISAMRSRRWRKFFEEHGVVISVASVRPRSIYSDGLHRQFSRQTKEDFWQKELEFIGQQPIHKTEVYGNEPGVFGYGDRYSEYRTHPSSVAGQFRSTLNYWHLARQFASPPVLNASFIECNPTKRVFAEQTQDVLWAMAGHSIQARRMVANSTVGRII